MSVDKTLTKSFSNSNALQQTHEGNHSKSTSKALHNTHTHTHTHTHRQEDRLLSCSSCKLDRNEEVRVANQTCCKKNPCHLPVAGNVSLLLTSTISPKETMVPLAVVSVVGGGMNGGSPGEVFPVIVKTW